MNRPPGFTSLLTTSDVDVEDAWLEALPSSIASASRERKAEWIAGRLAVQRALAKGGTEVSPMDFAGGSHRQVRGHNEWRFSISHTRDWAFAWVTRESACIGVDIEDLDRKISSGVEAKFRRGDDLSLDAIRLWSVKEACFKAVPDSQQTELVVSKIVIGENRFMVPERNLRGHWYQDTFGELVRSFAWVDLASKV